MLAKYGRQRASCRAEPRHATWWQSDLVGVDNGGLERALKNSNTHRVGVGYVSHERHVEGGCRRGGCVLKRLHFRNAAAAEVAHTVEKTTSHLRKRPLSLKHNVSSTAGRASSRSTATWPKVCTHCTAQRTVALHLQQHATCTCISHAAAAFDTAVAELEKAVQALQRMGVMTLNVQDGTNDRLVAEMYVIVALSFVLVCIVVGCFCQDAILH